MSPSTLLMKKRDGLELTDDEIRYLVDGYTNGLVADYQMSAFAMAVCIQGMSDRETATLTLAMQESGEKLSRDASDRRGRPRLDKHSTGGLGDKVSLILAPLLAVCDIDVPMISGRGLGLTGGTLDKLESIPGFSCDLDSQQLDEVLESVGAFITSATEHIAPADRKLYSLRDVTGTVESVPLITASILSKKISANLDALVMDVKVGSAAGMKTVDQALDLAESLIRVGDQADLPTSVIMSDMDQPLGQAVGNAIEVNEAIDVLRGRGPESVRALTLQLCANLIQTDDSQRDASIAQLASEIDSGRAYERFLAMVRAQGGNLSEDEHLPLAKSAEIRASASGYLESVDCLALGNVIVAMGGGRRQLGDQINPKVGVRIHRRIGQPVEAGDTIMTAYCDDVDSEPVHQLTTSFQISNQPVTERELILNRLDRSSLHL